MNHIECASPFASLILCSYIGQTLWSLGYARGIVRKNFSLINWNPNLEYDSQVDTRTFALMKRLVKESVRPYLRQLSFAFVFMAISSAAAAMSMWLLKPVINDIFVDQNKDMLWPLGLAIIFVFFGERPGAIRAICHHVLAGSAHCYRPSSRSL